MSKQEKTLRMKTPRVGRFRAKERNKKNDKKLPKGRAVAKIMETRGVAPVSEPQDLNIIDVTNRDTLSRKIIIEEVPVVRFAQAFLASAIKRGYYPDLQGIAQSENWAQLLAGLVYRMQQAISGQEVEGTEQAALWWELQTALMAKRLQFKTGNVQFRPEYGGPDLPQVQTHWQYATDTSGRNYYNVFSFPAGSNTVNEFPILEQSNYTFNALVAGNLINTLWAFMIGQTQFAGKKELVSLQNYRPIMDKDASAFAVVFPERGVGFQTPGGLRTTIASEVRIPSPVFSKFTGDSSGADQPSNRAIFQYHPSGGTSTYLACRLQEMKSPIELRNKGVPIFKFYEFHEIFESLAIWIGEIQTVAASSANITTLPPYPLTSLQFAIILRQTLMSLFSNEFGFDLSTVEPQLEEVPMVAFAVGNNGKQVNKIRVKLPSFHAESVLGVVRNPQTVRPGYVVDRIPILATKYTELSYLNVQYLWGEPPTNPVFAVDPDEINIDIIDGRTLINNTEAWVQFDCDQYARLVLSHNEWMIKATTFSTNQYDVGSEMGPRIFQSNYKSRIQKQGPLPGLDVVQRNISKTNSKKDIKVGTKSIKSVGQVVPQTFSPSQVLYQTQISGLMKFPKATTKYDTILWLPSFTVVGGGIDEEAYKGYVIEPNSLPQATYNLPLATSATAQTLYDVNRRRAQMDVRNVLGSPTEWETESEQLLKNGDGGLFATLAGMFGPGIGKLGQVVDSALS